MFGRNESPFHDVTIYLGQIRKRYLTPRPTMANLIFLFLLPMVRLLCLFKFWSLAMIQIIHGDQWWQPTLRDGHAKGQGP